MGRLANHERFNELLAWLLPVGGVAPCLHYPGMAEIPVGYDRFAAADARRYDQQWEDVCPAYALALVSHGGYQLPRDASEMEVLWDELGGESARLWPEIDPVVQRAWQWLEVHNGRNPSNAAS